MSDKSAAVAQEILICLGHGDRYTADDFELGAQIIRKAFPEEVAEEDAQSRILAGVRADLSTTTELLRESVRREEVLRQEIKNLSGKT
jgi:hypothetical protein